MILNEDEVVYGFVNENNILINFAIFKKNDFETIERVKNEYKANQAYQMNLSKEPARINETYWNGARFIWPSPFPSWVFSDEINEWQAPIPYPTVEEGSDEQYIWDENTTSWLLLPPSN